MLVKTPAGDVTVAYCTNVHPARGLDAVCAAIEQYSSALKDRLSPDEPLAIGLRLSDDEAKELLTGDALTRFADRLDELGVRTAAINGFPFGDFHGGRVKDDVHRPDWRDQRRAAYTLNLVRILAKLAPAGSHGGVSTSPLSYKPWGATTKADWSAITHNVAHAAAELAIASAESGVDLHLDIEPEPDGLIETSEEFAAWFTDRLEPVATRAIAEKTGISGENAADELRRRVAVCLDTCHSAVEFEEPADALDVYERAGVRLGRVQVSSALRVMIPERRPNRRLVRRTLEPFAESTYLHQTIGRRRDGSLAQWPDLPEALAALERTDARQWRVHYHVPIYLGELGGVHTTQASTREFVRLARDRGLCDLFEVETYTWSVLPGNAPNYGPKRGRHNGKDGPSTEDATCSEKDQQCIRLDLTDSIEREMRWLSEELARA